VAAFQPQAFGKYFLVDKLAMGGMAEIFLAKSQLKDDTRGYLVIKRILPHFTGNAQFVDMFIDEAKISSLLSHVNIVPLFDLGKIADTYFLAMEYVPGQDLKGVVKRCADRGVRLSYEHAAYVMREVCLGLDYAHTKHDGSGRPLAIVHRDISPQNVLVGYDGAVKITDFGIAKASSKLDSTQVGTLKGKFGYMAPEQVVTGMDLDHRSDIFASGVILWELITGQRLFAGRNEIEILERVRAARIEPPSTLDAEVPRELERIIFKSLMKDREKRYQWAKEMANDLTKFLAQVSPRFGAADMSAVMKELFATEIDNIKAKFNVVIGVAVDRAHAERGAELEASRPDHREDGERRPTVPPPKTAQMVTSSSPDPDPQSDEDDEPRTTVAPTPPPAAAPARVADKTRMTPSGRFAMPDVAPPPAPHPEPDNGTSALDLLAEIDAEAHEQGIRRDKTEDRKSAPPKPPPPPPRAPKPDDDEWEEKQEAPARATRKSVPVARRRGPSLLVRLGTWLLFLFAAGAFAVASLLYTGAVANPFAAPIVEVATTVESAVISIDGNIVLASGRGGRWPVGTGSRVVEVRAHGYKTFVQTLELATGDVAIVDAILEPADDATVDLSVSSVPPGATVWIGEELAGTTPVTVHPRIGNHTVRFTRAGYDEVAIPLALARPGEAAPLEVTLVPNIASVAVTSDPPGAFVTIDGKASGKAPVTVEGLKPGQSIVVQLVLKGYRTESRTVMVPGGDPFPVDVVLTSATAPRVEATPSPAESVASPAPTPGSTLGVNMGHLSIEVTGGWGEVHVDGVRISARTPVEKAEIAAGQHSVRIVNPVTGTERTVTVLITAGKETRRSLSLE
jgi:eukaryotic-like serine/threonine-protein kinase